jgi:hypothetical protein
VGSHGAAQQPVLDHRGGCGRDCQANPTQVAEAPGASGVAELLGQRPESRQVADPFEAVGSDGQPVELEHEHQPQH